MKLRQPQEVSRRCRWRIDDRCLTAATQVRYQLGQLKPLPACIWYGMQVGDFV
jgi:hypothetical protein